MKQLNMKQKVFCSIILSLFCSIISVAQSTYEIKGLVTDEDGGPLPGVNVIVPGSGNGTATDFDGNYTIMASSGQSLEFSYIGFASQTISLTGQKNIDVKLAQDATSLADVVVIGYGTRKKSDITGSVSSVTADELSAFPVLDATQAIQGRAAGVQVQSNNGGEPGAPISIRVRGTSSIGASSDPLIVVDGFIGATMPQAADIQSIEVLKDASSTAIYGSRGAGGVIMVTTKKGKNGKVNVELNSNYSVQNIINTYDLLDADGYAEYRNNIATATDGDPYEQGEGFTDWQDLIYDSGYTQNHQLSFSGGSDKLNVYSSLNYFQQEGVVADSEFERITFLTNASAQLNDKLKLSMNLFGSRGVQDGIETQSTGDNANGGGDDLISLSFRLRPDIDVFDENGDYNVVTGSGDTTANLAAIANEIDQETTTDTYRANFTADYNILENLKFNTSFGLRTVNETEAYFKPTLFTAYDQIAKATLDNLKSSTYLTESYLTYSPKINDKFNLDLLAGFSYQKNTSERFDVESIYSAESDPAILPEIFDLLGVNNIGYNASDQFIADSSFSESEIQSVFGRLSLDYADKYLLTATIRRDGSSNFAKNNKYATFPSAAIGWKVSEEDFLKDNEAVSLLKFRASYGLTGNQAIGPYDSLGAFNPDNGSLTEDRFANPDLKWETSYQTNIGVDLGFLNNRINLSLDYYNIDTEDLLYEVNRFPLAAGLGDTKQFQNVGEVNNKGFEVSLNTLNVSKDDFRWTTDLNWSTNKNEVVDLFLGDIIGDAGPSNISDITSTYIIREGESLGVFWGKQFLGVDETTGEEIFSEEETIIGDANADWTFGITNNFTYKNIDLSIFIQGVQGGEILNLNALVMSDGTSNTTSTDLPRVSEVTSQFVEDGSYVRLKNIALGYSLPTDIIKGLGLEGVRVSVSAQNVLTFTDYSGLDPEVSYFGSGGVDDEKSNTVQGHDYGNYPSIRSVNFSLNLKF